jgi:hypothetical protein
VTAAEPLTPSYRDRRSGRRRLNGVAVHGWGGRGLGETVLKLELVHNEIRKCRCRGLTTLTSSVRGGGVGRGLSILNPSGKCPSC